MDTQWHQFQELGLVKPMENNNNSSSGNINTSNLISSSRRERPQNGQASLNCPRCKSPHTKFCYYNNYSLTQPRYHCKTCRRYWTEGGSLRNVPVGGGSRKCGKKINSSSSSNLSTLMSYITPVSTTIASTPTITTQNPNQDLNLAFTTTATNTNNIANPPNVLNLLESGSRTMINPFMPKVQNYESAFGLHEFRSTRFALDGVSGSVNEGTVGGSRMLFPFEGKWQGGLTNNIVSNGSDAGDNPFLQKGLWTSMMGGGGSGEKFDHI